MLHPLIESWRINQQSNLQLLDLIPEAHLADSYGVRTRNVSRTWAHLHHIRLQWLGAADMDQAEGLERIARAEGKTIAGLKGHLEKSAAAMEAFLEKGIQTNEIPGFKGNPTVFVSYMIAHEAHHRGQIIVSLRLGGHLLGADGIHSLWNWTD